MNIYKEKIKLIKIALGLEAEMVTALLKDGVTTVEAEALEAGKKIYVVSESGEKAPAPEGVHFTEDGTKVTVDAEGTIVSVEAPVVEEVAMEEEVAVEEVKVEDEPTKEIEVIIDEKMAAYKMEIEEIVSAIVSDLLSVKEEMAKYKEKMSKTPADKKISTFNTEANKEKVDAVEMRIETLKNIRAGKYN